MLRLWGLNWSRRWRCSYERCARSSIPVRDGCQCPPAVDWLELAITNSLGEWPSSPIKKQLQICFMRLWHKRWQRSIIPEAATRR